MVKQKVRFKYTKLERSWILQDWANSAYSIMITTAVFPLFFKAVSEARGVSAADSTAYLGYANAIGTLVVSLVAPILGAIADYKGYRNPMFTLATGLGIIATISFAFISDENWVMLLILYAVSSIGFGAATIFYDASLVDSTTLDRIDRISSAGYGWGYMGSSIPFIIFIFLQLTNILPISQITLIKGSFVATALWWLVFTIPYWKNVEQKTSIEKQPQVVKNSFLRLWKTLKNTREYRNVFLFLIAYFFYIDGVGTIFQMATAIGLDIGLATNDLIVVMMVCQFVAFPFSILYGILAGRFGNKRMIYVGIITYTFTCLYASTLDSLLTFIILAVLIGTAQGGVQALSRSLFGQLIPKKQANEFFGFYNIFGRFAAVVGPILVGVISQITGNSLNGIVALSILFIIGGVILYFVEEPRREKELS